MSLQPDCVYDCIVIGAGYAGLTATHLLKQEGFRVALLEARDRVGGRVWTQHFDDGSYVDWGGAWVGPTQDRLYALAQSVGVATYPTYSNGKSIQYFRGKVKPYKGLIPPLPIGALLSLDRAIKRLNRLSKTINLAQPWQHPNAGKWDNQTLAQWMHQHVPFATARQFLTIAVEAIWAADPADISLLHALFYIRSGRDLDTLMNVENGAQAERFIGGAQTMANRLADSVADCLSVRSAVRAIRQQADYVEVCTETQTVRTRFVVVTVPPTLLSKIDFTPSLPPTRIQLMQRMPMGAVWKCYGIYEKPFWRSKNLNGLAATPDGFVTVTFDNSPADAAYGILMGFVLGRKAVAFSKLTDAERRETALGAFATFFGEEARQPIRYLDHTFMAEEWSGGCYAAVPGPGVWTSVGTVLREPMGRIHWAGTETAEVWNGYIEGAIRSGERAAADVSRLLRV